MTGVKKLLLSVIAKKLAGEPEVLRGPIRQGVEL
jgi:hypothetical protein